MLTTIHYLLSANLIDKSLNRSIGELANWSIGQYKLKRRTINVYTICEQFVSSGIKFF